MFVKLPQFVLPRDDPYHRLEHVVNKSQRVAALWFVGGIALLVAGLTTDPQRPLTIIAGILFSIVGLVSIRRRRS
jgi:hypothetical protein